MPPKKDDKGKKGGAPVIAGHVVTITEDELAEANGLPALNDFVYTNLYAFKMTRNQSRLTSSIKKLFCYTNTEDPDYSAEAAAKYKTVDMVQLLGLAQSRNLITEEEAADFSKLPTDRQRSILAQSTAESVTAI